MKSKFLLIIGILVIAAGVVSPIFSMFTQANPIGGKPIPYGGRVYYSKAMAISVGPNGDGTEPITVDGITIASDNPFYWQLSPLLQEKETLKTDTSRFSAPAVADLYIEWLDTQIHYYSHCAQFVVKQQDYRADLAFGGFDYLYDKFIFEHTDASQDVVTEAMNSIKGMDPASFKKKYYDITPAERQTAYEKADQALNTIFNVVENNDFPKYIEVRIQQQNDQISSIKDNIAIQEEAILKNPAQEENISPIIEDLKRQIQMIEENNIPVLKYRLEKHIVPGEDIWQNTALSDIEGSRSQLLYTTIVSEDKFTKDMNLLQQYKTYKKYVSTVQAQINQLNNNLIIAQKSLDANKPDMKYEPNGPRNKIVMFLDYSVIVALFAVLLGGWIMASEYQQGTIRLLMIRPRTRTKILMSKFIAAFAVSLAIYLAGSLLNIITNGICFGFSDLAFPNYTIGGEVNFFAYYLPKLAVCIIPILFAFTVAFMLSVVVKNIAVSIAVPIVCFIGCSILMSVFAYRDFINWIIYTPIPFVQLSSFFVPYSSIQQIIQRGIPISMPYGIMMLLVLSAISTVVSILVFKKRDIAN